jgi:hypothetical protein
MKEINFQRTTPFYSAENAALHNYHYEKVQSVVVSITITILDIIHRPVFYFKDNVSETGFSLRLQVEHIQLGLIDTASLCRRTQMSRFHLKMETESSLGNVVF